MRFGMAYSFPCTLLAYYTLRTNTRTNGMHSRCTVRIAHCSKSWSVAFDYFSTHTHTLAHTAIWSVAVSARICYFYSMPPMHSARFMCWLLLARGIHLSFSIFCSPSQFHNRSSVAFVHLHNRQPQLFCAGTLVGLHWIRSRRAIRSAHS